MRVKVDGELRELADDIVLAKTVAHTIEVLVDRLTVRAGLEKRLADSLETAFARGDEVARVERLADDGSVAEELLFSRRFACVACGTSLPEMSPRMFSFNSPQGACPDCNGLGVSRYFDPDLIIPDVRKSLAAGAVATRRSQDRRDSSRSVFTALAARCRFCARDPVGGALGERAQDRARRHRRQRGRDRVPQGRQAPHLHAGLGRLGRASSNGATRRPSRPGSGTSSKA